MSWPAFYRCFIIPVLLNTYTPCLTFSLIYIFTISPCQIQNKGFNIPYAFVGPVHMGPLGVDSEVLPQEARELPPVSVYVSESKHMSDSKLQEYTVTVAARIDK